MEIQIQLPLRGLKATYLITRNNDHTITARLRNYTGKTPPSYIRFYKTADGWASALEDAALVQAITTSQELLVAS